MDDLCKIMVVHIKTRDMKQQCQLNSCDLLHQQKQQICIGGGSYGV